MDMWKPTEQIIEIVSKCDPFREEKFKKGGKITMLIVVDFEVSVMKKVAEI